MFELIPQFRAFFRLATERKLTGSDQLMYLHLLNKFNEARRPETLRINDAELKEAMRLYDMEGREMSTELLRRGRQRLKAKGFIDFSNQKGCAPDYHLIPLATPVATPLATPDGTGLVSYTRAGTEIQRFRENNEEEGRGREQVHKGADATEASGILKEKEPPKVSDNLKEAPGLEEVAPPKESDTLTGAFPLKSPTGTFGEEEDLDEVVDLWSESGCFAKLDGELISELLLLLREYGKAAIFAAMQKAKRSQKRGVSFNYFKTILEGSQKNGKPENHSGAKYAAPRALPADLERELAEY